MSAHARIHAFTHARTHTHAHTRAHTLAGQGRLHETVRCDGEAVQLPAAADVLPPQVRESGHAAAAAAGVCTSRGTRPAPRAAAARHARAASLSRAADLTGGERRCRRR